MTSHSCLKHGFKMGSIKKNAMATKLVFRDDFLENLP